MVEPFDMGLCLHLQCLVHGGALHEDRHIAVQHINLLLCVNDHASGCPDASQTDDYTANKEEAADNAHQLDFVL